MTVNTSFNLEGVYLNQHLYKATPGESSLSVNERALFVAVKMARSKVLAVWKAFESVKAVAKISPSSNFMPWTRLFFAKCVKLKGRREYLKRVLLTC
jgi:hypothetical protein